eukprot:423245-Prorocentrum_minimum.AAC.2
MAAQVANLQAEELEGTPLHLARQQHYVGMPAARVRQWASSPLVRPEPPNPQNKQAVACNPKLKKQTNYHMGMVHAQWYTRGRVREAATVWDHAAAADAMEREARVEIAAAAQAAEAQRSQRAARHLAACEELAASQASLAELPRSLAS